MKKAPKMAFGRAIWSLGYLVKHAPKQAFLEIGDEIYKTALPNFQFLSSIRSIANTIIGIAYYIHKFPLDEDSINCLNQLTAKLITSYKNTRSENWHWFENLLTYDNGLLPLALFHSAEITGNEETMKIAIESTNFISKHSFENGYLNPIGNEEWFVKGQPKSIYDQQAFDAMAMTLLYKQAFIITKNKTYLEKLK